MRKRAKALLDELCSYGPRFHGTDEAAGAGRFLQDTLQAMGADVTPQRVELPGWSPGDDWHVEVQEPQPRSLRTWPMLWSGPTKGLVRGRIANYGHQGLWSDSMVWRRFAILENGSSAPVAFLHARDDGPAAPQPLPAGSDRSLPHIAISALDGKQLSEWIGDEIPVEVTVQCAAGPTGFAAAGQNYIVDIPGTGDGLVVLTGHWDTFYNTIGAYDNGSGTVTLLLLVEQLLREPRRPSVRIVFCTAEEWHLAGSRHYVDTLSPEELDAIDYVINIDGMGRGDYLEVFCGPEVFEAPAIKLVKRYCDETRPALRMNARFPPTKGTDDASFYAAGVPTLFFTFNDLHRLHQPEDTPNMGIARNVEFIIPLVMELLGALERPAIRPSGLELL